MFPLPFNSVMIDGLKLFDPVILEKEVCMLLAASWLIPITSPWVRDGAILVRDDRIQDYGPTESMQQKYPGEELRKFPGAALLPGFVNVHTHLELTVLRGRWKIPPFWEWIRQVVRAKYEWMQPDDFGWSALWGAAECLRAGITTVADPMDSGDSLDAVIQSGMRGLLFQEIFGKEPAQAEASLVELKRKMKIHHSRLEQEGLAVQERVQLGFSPHAPYTVSPSLFRQLAAWASVEGYPVSIHAAESLAEAQFVRDGTGPIGEYFQRERVKWDPPGGSTIAYLDQLGILRPRTQLVHCLQLAVEDYALLAERKCAIAHCPKSNARLGNGVMDLAGLQTAGLRIGLGSDSAASNDTLDLFEEMRMACFLHQLGVAQPGPSSLPSPDENVKLQPADFLRMATLGGADSLGLAHLIGSVETGKAADLIAVDLTNEHAAPVYDPQTSLVLSARAEDVRMTMINGRILFEKGSFFSLDVARLSREIHRIAQRLSSLP
jgi:cytosine/adenosine deaminase-related metal-dependent hydrolase